MWHKCLERLVMSVPIFMLHRERNACNTDGGLKLEDFAYCVQCNSKLLRNLEGSFRVLRAI